MYHVLVYKSDDELYTHHSAVVHFLSKELVELKDVVDRANEIVREKFNLDLEFRYAGYEVLPDFDVQGYVAVLFEKDGEIKSIVKEVTGDTSKLTEFRLSNLNIDIDYWNIAQVIEAVKGLKNYKAYRTYRGYHVRAPMEFNSFEEQLQEREKRYDDPERIKFDRLYLKHGLDFLVNVLFNEKVFVTETGARNKSREVELSDEDWKAEYYFTIDKVLPKIRVEEGNVSISVEDLPSVGMPWYKVVVKGRVTREEAVKIKDDFISNFWIRYGCKCSADVLKTCVYLAYSKLSPKYADVVKGCHVRYENGIVIRVPKELTKYVGLLIGRDGANVKSVQDMLGVRVVVEQEEVPDVVAMRRKLKDLMKEVVG